MNSVIRIGRKRDQRDLLIRSLATSVILYESIVTSPAKARMVQGTIDRLITIAKSEDKLTARRRLMAYLLDEKAVVKLLDELVGRYPDRVSGYTRRLRLSPRTGDAGGQVVLQLINTVLLDSAAKKGSAAGKKTSKAEVTSDTNDDHEGHDHA